MLTAPPTPRTDLLACELADRGLATDDATALSLALARRRPIAERVGWPGLAQVIRDLGLAESDARSAALAIVAFEWRERGATHGRVLRELHGVWENVGEIEAAAIEGARLHRALEACAPSERRVRRETRRGRTALWIATAAVLWVALGARLLAWL